MAIYGKWEDCAAQVGSHDGFALAFDFIRQVVDGSHPAVATLMALNERETKRIDLDGDRVYAMLQHFPTRQRAVQQAEAHRQYADVQFVLHGHEYMEVMPLDGLTVTRPYSEDGDAALYALPADGTRLLMDDGSCAILFPSDAHAPMQSREADTFSRRIVVKVRDPLAR